MIAPPEKKALEIATSATAGAMPVFKIHTMITIASKRRVDITIFLLKDQGLLPEFLDKSFDIKYKPPGLADKFRKQENGLYNHIDDG